MVWTIAQKKLRVQKRHWSHCVAPFSIRVNHGSISSLAAATHKTTVTIKKHNATLSRLFHKNPRLLGHFINIVPLTIGVFQKYHRLFHFYCCDPQTHGHNLSNLFHKNPRLLGAVPYTYFIVSIVCFVVCFDYLCFCGCLYKSITEYPCLNSSFTLLVYRALK